jgi:oligosaccharyltransferase complex subunit delta (ribophorin II)
MRPSSLFHRREQQELSSRISTSSWDLIPIQMPLRIQSGSIHLNANWRRLSDRVPLSKPVALEGADSLKIILTATEAGKPKRPHQAFLLLRDPDTGLESTFPLSMKETGKANVELVRCASSPRQCQAHEKQSQKDLPVQFLYSSQPLQATLLLASFGSSQPFSNHVFNLDVKVDANAPPPKYEKPLRYGKLPEIHHIFKPDPRSGPVVISIFFVGAVLATVPILLGVVSISRT